MDHICIQKHHLHGLLSFYPTAWRFHNNSGTMFSEQLRQKPNLLATMHNPKFGRKTALPSHTKPLNAFKIISGN